MLGRLVIRASVFTSLVGVLVSVGSAQVARVGGEFQVHVYTQSLQYRPAVAVDASGDFVVLWNALREGNQIDIFARRFAASGTPLGGEIQVTSSTTGNEIRSAVAADAAGSFVVVWMSTSTDFGFAQRFSSTGEPQGSEFQVNSSTNQSVRAPTIAAGPGGAFLVVWRSSSDIFARRFTSAGAPVATQFQVNQLTGFNDLPAAAVSADGDFVVTWSANNGGGISARRFDSSANPLTNDFQVNTSTVNFHWRPALAMDASGGFVIAWENGTYGIASYEIRAQRFDAAGAPLAGEFQVNSTTAGEQVYSAVALDGDGDLVVTWADSSASPVDPNNVSAQLFDPSGAAVGGEFRVNTYTPQFQSKPSIGITPGGDFVIAWSSNEGQDGDSGGIFAQRFSLPKAFDIDGDGLVLALTDGVLFARYFFGFRSDALVSDAVALTCSRCTPSPIENHLAGLAAIKRSQRTGPEFQVHSYTGGSQQAVAASADTDGDFVLAWHSPHDGSDVGIFARRFGSNGGPIAGEIQVNQYVTGAQSYPEVAMDGDGDFVVVWQSNGQDGSGQGIFARGFSSTGAAQGLEFQVSLTTYSSQQRPTIAMNSAGAFVVAWGNYPQYAYPDVFARRFDAARQPVGGEFLVNATVALTQVQPAAAMLDNGAFVVAFRFYGIFARRFDSSGAPLGGDIPVSTFGGDQQSNPDIAVDGSGGFVVTWHNLGQDGGLLGVFARRLDSAGVAKGDEFQVSTFTSGSQYAPRVKAIASGEFVVTWMGPAQSGPGVGVFERRFDSAGVPHAIELQIDRFTGGDQIVPAIAMDRGGDFVVSWEGTAQDGSGFGIFAQRFAAEHPADIDGDGRIRALTDGVLVLRYLFGLRDDTLIDGAVDASCTRCTAPAIELYLAGRI